MNDRFQQYANVRPLSFKSLFRLLSWRGVLVLGVAAALSIAIFIAAASVFLLVLPVVLVAGVVARLLAGSPAKRTPQRQGRPDLIEGQFEIVEPERLDQHGTTGWGSRRR